MDIISFYENERKDFRSEDNLMMSRYDKKSLKLDLPSKVKKQDNNNSALLTSPDLKLLKLDSPELERIILATAGSATPTPKQYRRGKGTSDLSVKEQQEQYVRGFEDALNKMRQQATTANTAITATVSILTSNNNNNIAKTVRDTGLNGESFPYTNTVASTVNNTPFLTSTTSINTTTSTFGTISTQDLALESLRNETNRTRTLQLMDSLKPSINVIQTESTNVETDEITAAQLLVDPVTATASTNPKNIGHVNVSEHSHNVSSPSMTTSSSPLSTVPIDLHKQEIVKFERKKHRNRVAASKCRKRKLERESNLQETVDSLKTKNTELCEMAATLRQQVCELKLRVMDHVKSGCEVLVKQQPS